MPYQLTKFEKGQIVAYHNIGLSNRKIAKELNKSHTSINTFLKQYLASGNVGRKRGSGRKRQLSEDQQEEVVSLVKRRRKVTCKTVIRELELDGV